MRAKLPVMLIVTMVTAARAAAPVRRSAIEGQPQVSPVVVRATGSRPSLALRAKRVNDLPLKAVTPVSAAFQSELNAAWNELPNSFRAGLSRAGWQVQLAEFVVDAAPDLASEHPRGWPAGTSWRQTDAVHLPKDRRLVIAEKRRTAKGEIVDSQRRAGVLRHELGHAFDLAQRGRYAALSASPEFRAAHELDISRMNAAQRTALAYYLQPGSAGRQEAFAEALAIRLGGGSDAANQATFTEGFVHVLRLAGAHAAAH